MRQVEYESSVGKIKLREVPENIEELSQILLNYEKMIQKEAIKILPSDVFTLDLDRYDVYRKNEKIGSIDVLSDGTLDTRRVFDLSEDNMKGMNLRVPIYLLAILRSVSNKIPHSSMGAKKDALNIWNRLNELGIATKVGGTICMLLIKN
jgi:hypothetical protein